MKEKWKKIFSKDHKLMYEGFVVDGLPYGTGTSYYENGNKCQEGVFDEKGLVHGREYYMNGNLRFEGTYTKNKGRGPNYPTFGTCYDEDGNEIYYGELTIRKLGDMGFPKIVKPEEYGFIPPKAGPDFSRRVWEPEEYKPRGVFYVKARGREREKLVGFLERNGFKCGEDEITTRESTIASRYPLEIRFENMEYGHIHTVTSSAAAEASRKTFRVDEFMDIFEYSFAYVIV